MSKRKPGDEVWIMAVVNRNSAPKGKTCVTIERDHPFVTSVPNKNIQDRLPTEAT